MEQEYILGDRSPESRMLLEKWKPAINTFIAEHPSGLRKNLSDNFEISDLKISQGDDGLPVYDFRINGSRAHVEGEQARKLEKYKSN